MIFEESIPRRRSRRPILDFARTMRENPTKAEAVLWTQIRKTGLRFRRQSVILGWIADFYCPRVGLIVEVDGQIHDTAEHIEADRRRDRILTSNGFAVLRFRNEEIFEDVQGVVARIVAKARERIGGEPTGMGSGGEPWRSPQSVEISDGE